MRSSHTFGLHGLYPALLGQPVRIDKTQLSTKILEVNLFAFAYRKLSYQYL